MLCKIRTVQFNSWTLGDRDLCRGGSAGAAVIALIRGSLSNAISPLCILLNERGALLTTVRRWLTEGAGRVDIGRVL